MEKKFSASAIILSILLLIRLIGQLFIFVLSLLQPTAYTFILLITTIIYLTAFVGVITKTRWALILVIIVASLDMITSILFNSHNYVIVIGAFVMDILLLFLSIKIIKRI